jgi:hypothetical protein
MKDIVKMNFVSTGTQNTRTNMIDFQTFSTCRVHLVVTSIFVTDCELLQLTRHMICSARVDVPIYVHPVRCSGRRRALLRGTHEGSFKALEALNHGVALLTTELTEDACLEVAALATAATTSSLHAAPDAATTTAATTTGVVVASSSSMATLGSHVCR